jgi:O-antigen ligase
MISSITFILFLFRQDLSKNQKKILFALSVFFAVSLFLTGSRGYYIAGFITYVAIFAFYFYKTKRIKEIFMFALLSGLFIGIIYSKNTFIQQMVQNTSISHEGS